MRTKTFKVWNLNKLSNLNNLEIGLTEFNNLRIFDGLDELKSLKSLKTLRLNFNCFLDFQNDKFFYLDDYIDLNYHE